MRQPEAGDGVRRSIKVLMIDHAIEIGGAEISMEGLVLGLAATRFNYTIALPGAGPLLSRLRKQNLEVVVVPLESWRWWVHDWESALKFFLSFPLQLLSLVRWLRFLRSAKPDLIHFNINRLVEPVVAARLLRIPSIMHFRDIPSRISSRFVLGKRFFFGLMNLAGHWIANSLATGKDIRGFAKCPVKVIPNGIDLPSFDLLVKAALSEPDNKSSFGAKYVVAMVALLNPWKNHADYVRLASVVLQRRRDVVFLVVGSGNVAYEASLKELACSLGVADQVKFVGFINNMAAIWASIDILVHTTDREPFGRVFIEAMAAGKPIVAIDNGGAAEIVVHNETGILAPVRSLDTMSDAVCKLLDDASLRQRMGAMGRRRVEQLYSLDKHCEAVVEVYEAIVQPALP